ncbi:MAG TPA: ABC transporter ATP-binding protein [Actinomycetes bacterium]|nr:ABC transporter ATP-binding protein [Actinomycetes bacterium]
MTTDVVDAQVVAELRGVHKRYGKVEALQGVDLQIHPAELVALLGPNGAGKTSAVGVLVGQRRPDAGSARVFGRDPTLPSARRLVGVTPQEAGFPDNLTVAEVVDLVRIHYPYPAPTQELLGRFGLVTVAGRRAAGLSGGPQRRLAVALAFAGRPRLVVLDEPTTGLDVEARHRLWEVVRTFVADGGSVLLTTHYLEEAQALASRVVVIADGTVIAQGGVDDITARAGLSRVRLRAPSLPELPAGTRVEASNGSYTLYTADPDGLVRGVSLQGVPFTGLQIDRASLEEAFLSLTGGAS